LTDPVTLPLAAAARTAFPARELDADEARELSFGRSLATRGIDGVHGAFAPDGTVVALLRESDGAARPVLVFAPAG
jgi:tRNA pseudouridine55 synthase